MALLPFSPSVIKQIEAKFETLKQEQIISDLETKLSNQSDREILELDGQPLTQRLVKKAFMKLALKHHPDKHQNDPEIKRQSHRAIYERARLAYHLLNAQFQS